MSPDARKHHTRRRSALIVVQGPGPVNGPNADDEQVRRTLQRLVRDTRADGGLVVVAGPGDAGLPDVPDSDIEVHGTARNPFEVDPTLARRLRTEGVARIVVVGLDDAAAASAATAAQRVGFTVDRASLLFESDDEFDDADSAIDVAWDRAPAPDPDGADEVEDADTKADSGTLTPGVDNGDPVIPGAAPVFAGGVGGTQGVGQSDEAQSPFTASTDHPPGGPTMDPVDDDDMIDSPYWDDTWALRGEPQPVSKDAEQPGGVRGWLTRKLDEVRAKDD